MGFGGIGPWPTDSHEDDHRYWCELFGVSFTISHARLQELIEEHHAAWKQIRRDREARRLWEAGREGRAQELRLRRARKRIKRAAYRKFNEPSPFLALMQGKGG